MKSERRIDHYELLFIEQTASPIKIKKAYREAAMLWHEDKVKDWLPAEDFLYADVMCKQINAAYATLSNTDARAEYDDELRAGRGATNEELQFKKVWGYLKSKYWRFMDPQGYIDELLKQNAALRQNPAAPQKSEDKTPNVSTSQHTQFSNDKPSKPTIDGLAHIVNLIDRDTVRLVLFFKNIESADYFARFWDKHGDKALCFSERKYTNEHGQNFKVLVSGVFTLTEDKKYLLKLLQRCIDISNTCTHFVKQERQHTFNDIYRLIMVGRMPFKY